MPDFYDMAAAFPDIFCSSETICVFKQREMAAVLVSALNA